MKPVIIESPYAGEVTRNLAYARAAMADAIKRGEAPLAPHLIYTQPGILQDLDPDQRALGMECGFTWGEWSDAVVVYEDLGVSPGMKKAIEHYGKEKKRIEYRTIPGWHWDDGGLGVVYTALDAIRDMTDLLARSKGEQRQGVLFMLVGLLEASKADVLHQLEAA